MKLFIVVQEEAGVRPSGNRLSHGHPTPAPVRTFLLLPHENRVEPNSDIVAYYLLRALEAVHRNGTSVR